MIIHFDLDGVCADWEYEFEKRYSINPCDVDKETMDNYRQEIDNSPDFFVNLLPIPSAIGALRYLRDNGYDVRILTSCGDINNLNVRKQKAEWVFKHIGVDININSVETSAEKAAFAKSFNGTPEGESTLLIDDRDKSLNPFREAGGKVLKFDKRTMRSSGELVTEILKLIK